MSKDDFRNRLEVKLYCSKHPNQELTFSTTSQIGAKSAYEINAKIFTNPCVMCEHEFERFNDAVEIVIHSHKK